MGAATHLSFSTQPSSSFDSEVALPQQPVVQALDAGGAIDTTYTGLITLSAPLGNLVRRSAGNAPVLNCVNGVASFTDIRVSAGQACALVASASGLTSATSSTLTPTAPGGRDGAAELPRVTPSTAYPGTITTVYRVGFTSTYANIQLAINAAVADNADTHSEIQVDAGVWTDQLTLKKKASGTGLIIIRPVSPFVCAQGTRAQPSMFASGAVKIFPGSGTLAVVTENGASHYRFAGVEIEGNAGTFIQLAEAGGATSVANCPDDLGFDRCYIHGSSSLVSTRAIEYGAKSLFLVDCAFAEIHGLGGDEQVIGGWDGPGPLLIDHCYLEASGEITMFGGADTPLVDVVTSDITITRNHFRKPLSWRWTTGAAGQWKSKNLTELKSARRVLYDGNVFENQWSDAQNCAITFGSASQAGGAPWMGIRDVTFRNNVIRNASRAIILNRANAGPIGPYQVYPVGQGTTGTSATGGTLASGTYYYKVTQLFNTPGFSGTTPVSADASGVTYAMSESTAKDISGSSDEIAITTGAGSTNSNTISWRQYSAGAGWRVYRGTSVGGESVYFDVAAGSLSFTDTGAAGTAGTPPTTDVLAVPVPMHRVSVHGNLFLVNNTSPYDDNSHSQNVMVLGVDDLTFQHNTIIADAETGIYLGAPTPARGHFDYNIISLRHYGVTGDIGGANPQQQFANAFASSVTKNLGLDTDTNFNTDISGYGGTWGGGNVATVGFADPTKLTNTGTRAATFAELLSAATLTSGTYANTTWTGDGTMVGANMTALATVVSNAVVSGEGTDLASDTTGLYGAADHLAVTTQPSALTASGTAHAVQPSGSVRDASNVTVTSDTSSVTATWVSESGTGTAGGTLTAAAVAGVWTFTNLSVTSAAGCTGHWHFADGSLTGTDSVTVTITAPATVGVPVTGALPGVVDQWRPQATREGLKVIVSPSPLIGTGGLVAVASNTVSVHIPVGRLRVSVLSLAFDAMVAAVSSGAITVQVFKVTASGTATALTNATSIASDVITVAGNLALPILASAYANSSSARIINGALGDFLRVDIVAAGSITTQPQLRVVAELAVTG